MSNNLPWSNLAENQDSPEAPINEAFGIFDAALTAVLSLDVSGENANVSTAQSVVRRIRIEGATTAGREVTLAAAKRILIVQSIEANTQDVAISVGTTDLVLAAGKSGIIVMDGTANGLELLTFGSGEGGGESSLPVGGSTGQVLKKASDADGDVFWSNDEVGGVPTFEFRAWRILIEAGPPPTDNAGVAEFLFDGVQATGGTPISGGSVSFYTPASAFDNDLSSYWASPDGGVVGSWIGYDFGTAKEIAEISIRAPTTNYGYRAPTRFKLQGCAIDPSVATAGDWETVKSFKTQKFGNSEIKTFTIADVIGSPKSYRYFRMTLGDRTASGGDTNNSSFAEWAFFTEDGVRKLASSITANRSNGSDTADKLNDKNPNSIWHSETATVPGTVITADLGAITSVSQIKILPRSGYPTQAPYNFQIAGSNDGSTWTNIGPAMTPGYTDGEWYVIEYAETATPPPETFGNTFIDVKSGSNQTVGASFTKLNMVDETSDVGSNWDVSNSVYMVPSDGIYSISGSVRVSDGTPSGRQYGVGVHTSEGDGPWFLWHDAGGNRSTYPYARLMKCTAGQQLRMFAWCETDTTIIAAGLQIVRVA